MLHTVLLHAYGTPDIRVLSGAPNRGFRMAVSIGLGLLCLGVQEKKQKGGEAFGNIKIKRGHPLRQDYFPLTARQVYKDTFKRFYVR